jgi:glycosyltransferase involved in cell wall biosynthesis
MIELVTKDFSTISGKKLAVNFITGLLSELDPLGQEISVISCDELPFASEFESFNGVRISRVPSFKRISSLKVYGDDWFRQAKPSFAKILLQKHIDFVKVAAKLMDMTQRVDVIHWFDLFTPLVNMLDLIPGLQRARNFATLVDYSTSLNDKFIPSFVRGLDKVIVNTRSLRDFLIKSLSIPKEKVEHIPIGVDLSLFVPPKDKDALKISAGIDPPRTVISWFGPISPSQPEDLCLLIDSIRRARVPEFNPLFLFAFKYGLPRILDSDSTYIRFLSGLRNAKEILDLSDLVILPFSRKKNWISYQPLTIIEALASGVPVVSMNYPGINEAVTDQFNGILLDEPRRLVDAAATLCKHNGRLKEMSQNARGTARKSYDIRDTARAYAKLWESDN